MSLAFSKSNLDVTAGLALVNLVAATLVAWVVGGDGGNANGNGGKEFHFLVSQLFYCPLEPLARLL